VISVIINFLNFLNLSNSGYNIDELTENLRPNITSSLGASEKDLKPWAKNTLIYALNRHTFQLVLDELAKK
jgi:hypothetical protein